MKLPDAGASADEEERCDVAERAESRLSGVDSDGRMAETENEAEEDGSCEASDARRDCNALRLLLISSARLSSDRGTAEGDVTGDSETVSGWSVFCCGCFTVLEEETALFDCCC